MTERGSPHAAKPGHIGGRKGFAGITRAEGALAKKIPSLPTTAPFSGTLWTLPLSATTSFYVLQSFPHIIITGILLAVYKVFWDVSFIYHCFSLYKYPLWHSEYSEERCLAIMFRLANDINRPVGTSSVTQHLTEGEHFSYLGSLCSTVFSSSHMSLTSPFFMLLYETSIMKMKAGGLGGLFFCREAKVTQVDTNSVYFTTKHKQTLRPIRCFSQYLGYNLCGSITFQETQSLL